MKKMMSFFLTSVRLRRVLVLPLLLLAPAVVLAANCTSTGSGNWQSTSTWSCGAVPGNGDFVTIQSGHTVTLNTNTANLGRMTVNSGGLLTENNAYQFNLEGNLILNGTMNIPTSTVRLVSDSVWSGSATGTALTASTFEGNSKNLTFANASVAYTIALRGSTPMLNIGSFNNNGVNKSVTVHMSGTNQSWTAYSTQYPSLRLGGSGTKTYGATSLDVLGNLTIDSGVTFDATNASGTNNLGGNLTRSGTFSVPTGSGTWNFNGSATQTITGGVTFYNMTVNNSSGLTLSSGDLTVGSSSSGTLTLTSGNITTGSNKVIIPKFCSTSVIAGSAWIVGQLQLTFPGFPKTCLYRVGDATTYAPITVEVPYFGGVGSLTGATLTGSTTSGEHPLIANSGLDSTKSVNRYWTLGAAADQFGCVPFGSDQYNTGYYIATFQFVNGDKDGGADTSNFKVGRYFGSWAAPSVYATSATSTSIKVEPGSSGYAPFGTFALGEQIGPPTNSGIDPTVCPLTPPPEPAGIFTAYETSTTPSNNAYGHLLTKVAGVPYSVDVVALNNTKSAVKTSFNGALTVQVVGLSTYSGSVSLDANGCPTGATTLASPGSVNIVNGRSTISFPAVPNAWPYAKIRITDGSTVACSAEAFAIRPASLSVLFRDQNWTTAGTTNTLNVASATGTPIHKAGQPFQVTATGYNGAASPAVTSNFTGTALTQSGLAAVSPATIVGTLSLGTLTPSGGTLTSTTATFSEVGSFSVDLQEQNFTLVDQTDGTPSSCSNTAPYGLYTCSGTVTGGRFVPNHFVITSPVFTPSCALGSSMSYMGAPLGLSFTLTAFNASNAITQNYVGTLAKLDAATTSIWPLAANASGALWGLGGVQIPALGSPVYFPVTRFSVTNPTGTWASGAVNVSTTLTFARLSNTSAETSYGLFKLGLAPKDSDGVTVLDSALNLDADAAITNAGAPITSSDHVQVGATAMRYGRMVLENVVGSERLSLPMLARAEYFDGTGWQLNRDDRCTTLRTSTSASFVDLTGGCALYNSTLATCTLPTGSLSAAQEGIKVFNAAGTGFNAQSTKPQFAGGATTTNLSYGIANILLSAPNLPGNVQVSAVVPDYLRMNSTYPTGTARFGAFRANPRFILMRESY